MKNTRVTIENRTGDRLAAILSQPASGRTLAFAVFAHCFTCSKNLHAVSRISSALAQQGIAVLRFDFAGLGESEGEFSDTTFSSNITDVVDAARWLEVNHEPATILVGHSLGGAAILHAAEELPSARAICTIGAPFDPSHVAHLFEEDISSIEGDGVARVSIGGRPFDIKRQFIADLRTHDAETVIRALRRPLLIFHSPTDNVVGIENAALIFEAARHPKSFMSLDTADHLLTAPSDSSLVASVLGAWAREFLDSPPEVALKPAIGHNRVVAHIGRSKYRTEINANGHPIIADEPPEVGGSNTGPSPYELLGSALGACTAMTLRMYADRKQWPMETATVLVEYSKVHAKDCDCDVETDGKIDLLRRTVTVTGDLDDAQRSRILEIANRCPVHRTLEGDIVIKTELAYEEEVI